MKMLEPNIDEILIRLRAELTRSADSMYPRAEADAQRRVDTYSAKSAIQTRLDIHQFVPSFHPNVEGRYHAKDLLKFNDREFILVAYLAVLRRPADMKGLEDYLRTLRAGRLKASILGSLKCSTEGRRAAVQIKGLWWRQAIGDVWRVDLLGTKPLAIIGRKAIQRKWSF